MQYMLWQLNCDLWMPLPIKNFTKRELNAFLLILIFIFLLSKLFLVQFQHHPHIDLMFYSRKLLIFLCAQHCVWDNSVNPMSLLKCEYAKYSNHNIMIITSFYTTPLYSTHAQMFFYNNTTSCIRQSKSIKMCSVCMKWFKRSHCQTQTDLKGGQ